MNNERDDVNPEFNKAKLFCEDIRMINRLYQPERTTSSQAISPYVLRNEAQPSAIHIRFVRPAVWSRFTARRNAGACSGLGRQPNPNLKASNRRAEVCGAPSGDSFQPAFFQSSTDSP